MAQKAETIITNKIIASIVAAGGNAFHVHGSMFQRKGEPDICGELPYKGRMYHLKIEVKTLAKTSKPDPLQIYRLQGYHKADYVAGVVRSPEEFWQLVQDHHDYLQEQTHVSFKEFIEADPYNLYDINHHWGDLLYGRT